MIPEHIQVWLMNWTVPFFCLFAFFVLLIYFRPTKIIRWAVFGIVCFSAYSVYTWFQQPWFTEENKAAWLTRLETLFEKEKWDEAKNFIFKVSKQTKDEQYIEVLKTMQKQLEEISPAEDSLPQTAKDEVSLPPITPPKIEIGPSDSAEFYYQKGLEKKHQHKYAEAKAYFSQVIALKPDHPLGYFARGLVLREEKEYNKAASDLLKAIEMRPDYGEVHYHLARIYLLQEEYDKALAYTRTAILFRPNLADAYEQMGDIYWYKQEKGSALMNYLKAQELDPDNLVISQKIQQLRDF